MLGQECSSQYDTVGFEPAVDSCRHEAGSNRSIIAQHLLRKMKYLWSPMLDLNQRYSSPQMKCHTRLGESELLG